MTCRFDDLRCKEIINIRTGAKLGYPDDIEFDVHSAKIVKLIVQGRAKFFGLFGREEDFMILWDDIEVIGEDTILVTCDFPVRPRGRRRQE
jgi:YlmC/YmxH family sporulation protein